MVEVSFFFFFFFSGERFWGIQIDCSQKKITLESSCDQPFKACSQKTKQNSYEKQKKKEKEKEKLNRKLCVSFCKEKEGEKSEGRRSERSE